MPRELFGKDHQFMPQSETLSFEEIERLARIFVQLGVNKIRLTGGEPLLRRNLPDLIEKLVAIEGLEDIGLTTNASLLEIMAPKLKDAGLKRVNISLDAIDDALFQSINGSSIRIERVFTGIKKVKAVVLEVKDMNV